MTNMLPKVLFINPWDRLIGPNRYLAEMLRHMPELAVRSTVVFHETNDALEEYRSMGCRVAVWPEVKLIHPHFTASNLICFIRTHSVGLAKVVQRLRPLRPDVVVTNTESVAVGGMAARILGAPHVQVVHSLLFRHHWGHLSSLIGIYARWLSFITDHFIGVSQTVKQMLSEYGIASNRITVVPNGFDMQEIRERSARPPSDSVQNLIRERHPVLVSVGRVAPMKGHDILVEAVSKIQQAYPSLICLIVGRNGSEEGVEDVATFKRDLEKRIEAYHLEKNVYFLGEVDYVPEVLARSDLYIHPSWTESFSRVVAEALICGKPVVCTNAGALPEVAGQQGAVFVPPGDAEALTEGVLRVLKDEPFRQGIVSSGRGYVESHFPVCQTTEKLLEVLRSAAADRVRRHGH
jgi:glycosyltransferase involved in cell wall biosynthesis